MRAPSIALIALLVGCGGRQLGDGVDPGLDAATDGSADGGGSDTATVDSATEDVPVSDTSADVPVGPGDRKKTCDALIAAICGAPTKACCEASKVPFDVDACTAGTRSWCGFRMDQVEAGIVTFDIGKLDACAKGYVAAFNGCNVDFLSYLSDIRPCSRLFDGTRAPGDTCNPKIPDQCKAGGGGVAFCDDKLKRCRVYQINGVGSLCNYTGSTVRYCDKGLYCDAGGSGTCKVAKKTGDACLGPGDLSCGLEGNVCKDLKCQPGLPGGAACSTYDECSSLTCDAGKCGSVTIGMATPEVCNGASTTG